MSLEFVFFYLTFAIARYNCAIIHQPHRASKVFVVLN